MVVSRFASLLWVGALALGASQISFADRDYNQGGGHYRQDDIPNCPAYALKSQNGGNPGSLDINNEDVLEWKREGRNQRHERGRIKGHIVRIYPDKNSHEHFAIQIGPGSDDTIEVIYNHAFGEMPAPEVGMEVEACGDYITANAPSPAPGGKTYPASPDGAIIHWVHIAPDRSGHHSGYVVIDGVLVGQDLTNARPRPPRPPRGPRKQRRPRIEHELYQLAI